ncbi:MAG: dihydrolipoamide acetyltransferase family protein [Longimicrobiales bacterium]|nr:dihydrolipoamide acetyltransferase family protein [Longimicrobiales bacterium]
MARIEVPMPQMGESIAEGTVSKWLKSLGDTVERDEPILEISTDKVDAEIPAPTAGTIVAVEVQEGETVEVGTIVAYIDDEGGAPDQAAASSSAEEPEAAAPPASEPEPADEPAAAPAASGGTASGEADAGSEAGSEPRAEPGSEEERLRTRSTPVVRKIAEEHGVRIEDVPGTGHAGRVTKQDILDFIESGGADAKPAPAEAPEPSAEKAAPAPGVRPSTPATSGPVDASELAKWFYGKVEHPEFPVRSADSVEPMDKIRRLTAEHMVLAKRVAPHVHSFIEIDFTAIDHIRAQHKARWAEQGARVSYTAFVAWAVSRLVREFPAINGTVSGNNIIHRGNVNLGMAVDLDPGLIVPVIHDADGLSLVGIGRKIIDLAERARSRQLQPQEIQGATFSITNPGVLGTVVGMPVIPKGTSAILGTGAIEKRVVALTDPETGNDTIGIRKRSFFSMGYDHRLVDGADAARFLARLKELLEDFPEDA